MKKITCKEMANLPFKYIRVYNGYGLFYYANVAIDKVKNKRKLALNENTIWISYKPVTIHHVISYRGGLL